MTDMAMGRPSKFKPAALASSQADMISELERIGATGDELAAFGETERSFDDYIFCWLAIYRDDRLGVIAARKKKLSSWKEKSSTPHRRILDATRARIWASLKGRADGALFSRLGYSIDELASHLQSKFTEGMSMDNYGEWHVDHIRPCATYDMTDENEFNDCWALKNLQPLWAQDNCKKGARYGEA